MSIPSSKPILVRRETAKQGPLRARPLTWLLIPRGELLVPAEFTTLAEATAPSLSGAEGASKLFILDASALPTERLPETSLVSAVPAPGVTT